MAGLNDLDPSTPAGSISPTTGDDEIRALKQKIKDFAIVEHAYDGKHTILRGNVGVRPAAGTQGRLFILTAPSVADELQEDTGSAWVTITSNQTVINYVNNLSAHSTQADLSNPESTGHKAGSVKGATIADMAIVKKHVMAGGSPDSIADVFNGSANGDNFHTHGITTILANYRDFPVGVTQWTIPSNFIFVVAGGSGAGGGKIINGGGGQCGTQFQGGGGASGAINEKSLMGLAGTVVSVTVAVAGISATSSTDGSDGNDTTFGSFFIALKGNKATSLTGVGIGGIGNGNNGTDGAYGQSQSGGQGIGGASVNHPYLPLSSGKGGDGAYATFTNFCTGRVDHDGTAPGDGFCRVYY